MPLKTPPPFGLRSHISGGPKNAPTLTAIKDSRCGIYVTFWYEVNKDFISFIKDLISALFLLNASATGFVSDF